MRHFSHFCFVAPMSHQGHNHITPFHNHGTPMSQPCHFNITLISYIYQTHVTTMSYPCHTQLQPCHSNITLISYIYHTHVTTMSHPCHTRLPTCHNQVTCCPRGCMRSKYLLNIVDGKIAKPPRAGAIVKKYCVAA